MKVGDVFVIEQPTLSYSPAALDLFRSWARDAVSLAERHYNCTFGHVDFGVGCGVYAARAACVSVSS